MNSPALGEASKDGLLSTSGFYIRIKKPLDTGYLNITFGVMKETSKSSMWKYNDNQMGGAWTLHILSSLFQVPPTHPYSLFFYPYSL